MNGSAATPRRGRATIAEVGRSEPTRSLGPRARTILEALERYLETVSPSLLPGVLVALSTQMTAATLRLVEHRTSLPDGAAPDENLSIEEAARRLGVSVDYLYRHPLPFRVRVGRRLLFSSRGLERWILEQQGLEEWR